MAAEFWKCIYFEETNVSNFMTFFVKLKFCYLLLTRRIPIFPKRNLALFYIENIHSGINISIQDIDSLLELAKNIWTKSAWGVSWYVTFSILLTKNGNYRIITSYWRYNYVIVDLDKILGQILKDGFEYLTLDKFHRSICIFEA